MRHRSGGKLFWLVLLLYSIGIIVAYNKLQFIVQCKLIESGKLDKREQIEFQVAQFAESTESQIQKVLGDNNLCTNISQYDFINFEELYQNGVQNGDVIQFTLKGDKQGDISTSKMIVKYGFRNVVDYYKQDDKPVTTEPWQIIGVIMTTDSVTGLDKLDFIQERINTGNTDYTVECTVLGQVGKLEQKLTTDESRVVISDNTEVQEEDSDE